MVVEGTYNEETGKLKAESIKVNLEENRKLTRTALIEQAPRLEHGDEGWYGTFFSDGQRIQIRPETDFTLKLNKSEKKALREKNKTQPSSKVKKDSSKKCPSYELPQREHPRGNRGKTDGRASP